MTPSLAGRRVVVTAAGDVATRLSGRLQASDASVLECPTIAFGHDDETRSNARWAMLQLVEGVHEWVLFTSANAVDPLVQEMGDAIFTAFGGRVKVGAVGPATAEKLRRYGIEVDVLPERFSASGLADALGEPQGTKRILAPRAQDAPQHALDALRARGWEVHEAAVYRTIAVVPPPDAVTPIRAGEFDAVTFASGSAARSFAANVAAPDDLGLGPRGDSPQLVACIGRQSTVAATDAGFRVDVEAEEHTVDGLVHALAHRFAAA